MIFVHCSVKWLGASLIAALLIAVVAVGAGEESREPVSRSGPAVLLELFTSQGCSSCPPADRILRSLAADDELRGIVVPLAFHVDYWDRLGWRDPFSSPDWSDRQRDYSRAWRADRVYTPQIVVGGATDVVGSDERGIRRAIAAELRRRPPVHLAMSARADGAQVKVNATVAIDGSIGIGPLDLMLVVFESGFRTDVARGENGGRTLENDFVVRRLERIVSMAAAMGSTSHSAVIALDPRWKTERLGVAIFVQHPHTRRVFGAVSGKLVVERE